MVVVLEPVELDGCVWLSEPAGVSKPIFARGARNKVLGVPRYVKPVIVNGMYTPRSSRAVFWFARNVSKVVVLPELVLAHPDVPELVLLPVPLLPVVLVGAQEVTGIAVNRVSKKELIPGGHFKAGVTPLVCFRPR